MRRLYATRVDLRRVGKPDAAAPNGVGQLAQDRDGRVPAYAGVGDAHAVGERLAGQQILAAGVDMAFDHRADDPILAARDLRGDIARHLELPFVLLLAVRVR